MRPAGVAAARVGQGARPAAWGACSGMGVACQGGCELRSGCVTSGYPVDLPVEQRAAVGALGMANAQLERLVRLGTGESTGQGAGRSAHSAMRPMRISRTRWLSLQSMHLVKAEGMSRRSVAGALAALRVCAVRLCTEARCTKGRSAHAMRLGTWRIVAARKQGAEVLREQ